MSSSRLPMGLGSLWLALLSTGCTIITQEIDPAATEERVAILQDGSTHYREVLERFGPPSRLSALGNGAVFLYEHASTNEYQFTPNLGVFGIGWLGYFKLAIAGATKTGKTAVLVFDEQGVLRAHGTLDRKDWLGWGWSIQFFYGVGSLVDTSSFYDRTNQLDWGRSWLRSLPEQLNLAQSLESGASGIQLREAPSAVGQSALEQRP